MSEKTTTLDGGVVLDDALGAYVRQREEVLEKVRRTLIACLDLRRASDEIDPDTVLFGTGLGLDSVDAVELIISLEMEFGIKLGTDEARRTALRSVNAVVDAVLAAKPDAEEGAPV
jgi:acyl carrier protein